MASLLGAAASGGREYVLKIVADVKDAVKGVDDVADKTTSMKDKVMGIGKSVAAGLAVGAVAKFGTDVVNVAADADDAMDAVQASFGGASKAIVDFSKTSADNMGISADQYQAMAAKTGNLLQSMGIDAQTAGQQTITMSQRAADMAAIWGTSTEEAMDAINKAMGGATKGLQKFGVKLDSAEIDARAMAKGYVDASGKVTQAGKAIAAQELILEKTQNVQGAFADNSKDLGSQQEILAAKFRDLQASLGSALLPILTQLMQVLQPLMNFLVANMGWLAPLAGIIAGIAAAVKLWSIAQGILNVVMAANPIILVAAAIAALVAGIIIAYQKVDWFRNMVDAMGRAVVAVFDWIVDTAKTVFNWIKDNWPLLLAILTGPFGTAILLITKNWDTIKSFLSGLLDWIRNLFSGLGERIAGAVSNVLAIIKYPFEQAWNWVKQVPQWIVDAFGKIIDGVRRVFTGLGDAITYPFKIAFEAIKRLWNNTVGGFGFSVPSWVPGIGGKGWHIPEMARGGIVTRPTIALIGESGAEAVIPLTGPNALQAAQPTIVNINVYALTANAEVGRRVYDSLLEYERISGKAI